MVAGGGASVIYADTVGDMGYAQELGNYAGGCGWLGGFACRCFWLWATHRSGATMWVRMGWLLRLPWWWWWCNHRLLTPLVLAVPVYAVWCAGSRCLCGSVGGGRAGWRQWGWGGWEGLGGCEWIGAGGTMLGREPFGSIAGGGIGVSVGGSAGMAGMLG